MADLIGLYNQGIKWQVTIKGINKEDRICMKSQTPKTKFAGEAFQV